jgi:hypothetical protein
VILALRNRVRGFLHVRKERAAPRRGAKPTIGAHIVCDDVRMTIQAGLSDDLWRWLLDQGWREPAYRPDRRSYREIPSTWVTRLIDSSPETRAQVLAAALAKASHRPALRNPGTAPSYIKRG